MAEAPPNDADLEKLLTQLLRVVSPAWTGDAPGTAQTMANGAVPVPGLSASEARALIQLASARGIAQGQLAALLGLDKSTVSRLAAGLERKGWLRRGRDGENQRYVRLYLTAEGGEVAARVWQAWQSRQARILGALSTDERAGLSAGLRGLVRGLAAEGLLGEVNGNGGPAAAGPGAAAADGLPVPQAAGASANPGNTEADIASADVPPIRQSDGLSASHA